MSGPELGQVVSSDGQKSHQTRSSSTLLTDTSTAYADTSVEDAGENVPLLRSQGKEHTDEDVPYKNIDGKRFWRLFTCILLAYLLAYFDTTFMASSHPVITSYFNASNSASWLSTVFYLSSTVSQPLYGRLSDTFGRRPVYVFAMSLFGVTMAWCGLAESIGSFIAARAVCGLGAGGVIALSNILMADTIKIDSRGVYQSYLNMSYGAGNGLGAALGGILCDKLGWRAAFFIQIPFIVVFIVLAYSSIPTDLGPNYAAESGGSALTALKNFDFAGAAALTCTMSGLILGINLGGNVLTWTHPLVVSALVVFAIAAPALVFAEKQAALPILPMPYLSRIPIGNLMWGNFLSSIAINTVLFNIPLLLQAARQTSATASGLYLLSPLIGISISSVFAGFFIKRTLRLKPMMGVGVVLLFLGTLTVSCITIPRIPAWAIIILNPWTSIGQGFWFPAATVGVLAISPDAEQAVASTTLGLARNLGAILGVAISSWILQSMLQVYLEKTVTGDVLSKQKIIKQVRKSVRAISGLEEPHRAEVITAYTDALRITFLSGAVFGIVVVCLVLPARIPKIHAHNEDQSAESDEASRRDIDS